MPIRRVTGATGSGELTSDGLLASLSYVERKYDDVSPDEHLDIAPMLAPAVASP